MTLRQLGLFVALAVLVADQAVKAALLARPTEARDEVVPLLPVVDLVFRWNRGISFSFFAQNTAAGVAMLLSLTIAAIVLLGWWLMRCQTSLTAVGLGSIIGGAVGNALDRVVHGAVVDYLDLHAFGRHFFVFNLADAAISVGVALLMVDLAFAPHPATRLEDP